MTAPQEIALYRGKKRDDYETKQMNARVQYEYLSYVVPEHERREIDSCAHCGARCYLEGDGVSGSSQAAPAPVTQAGAQRSTSQTSQGSAPLTQGSPKRTRTGLDLLDALKEVQSLKASGLLDTPEAKALKEKIMREQ